MKKTTLSIVLALVLVLSFSVMSASAQEWDDTFVLTVFNDLQIMYPALFTSEGENDLLFADMDMFNNPGQAPSEPTVEAAPEEGVVAKAAIDVDSSGEIYGTLEGSFSPCGDGTIKIDMEILREDYVNDPSSFYDANAYRGNKSVTYIRNMVADVTVDGITYTDLSINNCESTGGDTCHAVYFDSKGLARMSGYVQLPVVIDDTISNVYVVVRISHSTYMTVLWDTTADILPEITLTGVAYPDSHDFCQGNLTELALGGLPAVQGRYDENTGEARVRATLANKYSYVPAYAIPAEVWVDGSAYSDYTCRYTIYNSATGYPQTDYCEYGKGIRLAQNEVIRFDITIPHISGHHTGVIPFEFRVGGALDMLYGDLEPVSNPCPPESKLSVMDPLKPFMTFYQQDGDSAIEASGPYSVYEGGVWGMYEKCGRHAYIMTRLRNDGTKDEIINLDNVAVAINGGTPMKFKWVLATLPQGKGNTIILGPDDDVILLGRAKVTEITSQLNSDYEMTAAVNFLDYGIYTTGKVYSDRNNTRCYPAP